MITADENTRSEEQDCWQHQHEDITQIYKSLVFSRPCIPGPQGYHTWSPHNRHLACLFALGVIWKHFWIKITNFSRNSIGSLAPGLPCEATSTKVPESYSEQYWFSKVDLLYLIQWNMLSCTSKLISAIFMLIFKRGIAQLSPMNLFILKEMRKIYSQLLEIILC